MSPDRMISCKLSAVVEACMIAGDSKPFEKTIWTPPIHVEKFELTFHLSFVALIGLSTGIFRRSSSDGQVKSTGK